MMNVAPRNRVTLPEGWHLSVEASGVDCSIPGIYLWTIEDAGVYVGNYKNISRPRTDYRRNVERLLNGEPYRLSKPDKFRAIHHALAKAVREGRRITLTILENPSFEQLHARERELILRIGTLNGR